MTGPAEPTPAQPTPTEPTPPAQALPPSAPQDPSRVLGVSLAASGVLMIIVAIWLGATVDPVLYVIAAVGLADFVFAWLFATGRIGPAARRRRAAEASGDAAAEAEIDPSYNPYARED